VESPFVASIGGIAPLAFYILPDGVLIKGYHLPRNVTVTSPSKNRLDVFYDSVASKDCIISSIPG
jgi:hypothetical protein